MRKVISRPSPRMLKVSTFQMTVRSGCAGSLVIPSGNTGPGECLSMRNFQMNWIWVDKSHAWQEAKRWNKQRTSEVSRTSRALAQVSLSGMLMETWRPRKDEKGAGEVDGDPESTLLKRLLNYSEAAEKARQRLKDPRKQQVEPQKQTDEQRKRRNFAGILERRLQELQPSVIR